MVKLVASCKLDYVTRTSTKLPMNKKPTALQNLLATQLRTLREKKGWSQEELAHKAGIHVTYLSGLECSRRNPTLKTLEQIARALGTQVATFFKLNSIDAEDTTK